MKSYYLPLIALVLDIANNSTAIPGSRDIPIVFTQSSHPSLYSMFPKQMLQGFSFWVLGIMFEQGQFDLRPNHSLNEDFPEIKARTVKDLMAEAWKEA